MAATITALFFQWEKTEEAVFLMFYEEWDDASFIELFLCASYEGLLSRFLMSSWNFEWLLVT